MFKIQSSLSKAVEVKDVEVLTTFEMKKVMGGNQAAVGQYLEVLYGTDGIVVEDINQV
ncbi:MAG: hypothetical protein AAF985_25200 [Bacteroidota bacterium]